MTSKFEERDSFHCDVDCKKLIVGTSLHILTYTQGNVFHSMKLYRIYLREKGKKCPSTMENRANLFLFKFSLRHALIISNLV